MRSVLTQLLRQSEQRARQTAHGSDAVLAQQTLAGARGAAELAERFARGERGNSVALTSLDGEGHMRRAWIVGYTSTEDPAAWAD
jgi:hypothetical protein